MSSSPQLFVTGTAVQRISRRHVQVSIPHVSKEYHQHYKVIDYFDQLAEGTLLVGGVTDPGCTFSIGCSMLLL